MLTSPRSPPNLIAVSVLESHASPAPPVSRLPIPLTRRGWPELVVLAFIHRLVIAAWTSSIGADSVAYLPAAELFREGRFSDGLDSGLHPLYPLLTGLVSLLTGSVEVSAVLVAVVTGALVPLPLFLFVKQLWNERVAWFTGFLYALQPILALDTSEAYPTSLFLLLFFCAAACGVHAVTSPRWSLYPLAGAIAALCYLTRTEGIHAAVFLGLGTAWIVAGVVLRKIRGAAPETTRRERLRFVAGVLAGGATFILVCLPYLGYVSQKLGRVGFTLKGGQTLLDKALGEQDSEEEAKPRPTAAEAIAKHTSVWRYMGKKVSKALFWPLIPFYLIGFFCVRRQGGDWRRLVPIPIMSLLAFVPALLLLTLTPNHMPSHRYMVLSGMLLLPWAAAAALSLGDWMTGDRRPPFLRRWGWALLLAFFLLLLPLKSVRPRRPYESTLPVAGAWLREQSLGPNRILVTSHPKLAYYGRCVQVPLPSIWTDYDNPPPVLRLRGDYSKGLDSETALEWARQARREFDRSGGALLALDQTAVDHFFGVEYLKQLEVVGFRQKKVISPEPGEKAMTVWFFAVEHP